MIGRRPPPLPLQRRAGQGAWDAIVIGTGVGGSCTAGLLAGRGLRVLVLEKNERVGGILASYERDGFKIDFGSHLISRGPNGALGQVVKSLGLRWPRFLRHKVPVRARGIFAVDAPGDHWGLPGAALRAAKALHLRGKEQRRLIAMLLKMAALRGDELRAWDRRTLDEFVLAHTDHGAVYFLFAFLCSAFFVLPPWEASAGEAIRCLRELLWDYSLAYVEGGMDSLPHALLSVVAGAGGQIVVGARATAIRRRGDRLAVVTDGGQEVSAPVVACNLAPQDLLALLEPGAVPPEWEARAQAIVPSGNAHQIKLGLSRPLLDEGCLCGGVSLQGITIDDLHPGLMRSSVERIHRGEFVDPMAIYAPVPSNFDPSLAPPGKQLLVGSIYAPTREDPVDPPGVWRDQILQHLEAMVPGLQGAIEFVELTPVPGVGRWMGKSSNAAICNAQVPGQVGPDRLPVATPLPGLFLCGDGAGGHGIGTELAADSARQAASGMIGFLETARR